MSYCPVEDCLNPPDDNPRWGGLCFKHGIRTLAFHPGHLRNNLHPGLTMKESQDKIKADAAKGGYEVEPVARGT